MKKLVTILMLMVGLPAQAQIATNVALQESQSIDSVKVKDIKLFCSGSYKVIGLSNFSVEVSEQPSRGPNPIITTTYLADAKVKVTYSSEDCELMKKKYEINFVKDEVLNAKVSSFTGDLKEHFLNKKGNFNFKHNIYFESGDGNLLLFPEVSGEYFNLNLKKASAYYLNFNFSNSKFVDGDKYKNYFSINTEKLYGSLPYNFLKEKEKLKKVIIDKINGIKDFSTNKSKQKPFFKALSLVEPNNYYDKIPYDSAEMKAHFASYLETMIDVVSLVTKGTVSIHPEDPVTEGLAVINHMLSYELTKFGGSDDPDIKLSVFKFLPYIIDPTLHTQYSEKLDLHSGEVFEMATYAKELIESNASALVKAQYINAFKNFEAYGSYMNEKTKEIVDSLFN